MYVYDKNPVYLKSKIFHVTVCPRSLVFFYSKYTNKGEKTFWTYSRKSTKIGHVIVDRQNPGLRRRGEYDKFMQIFLLLYVLDYATQWHYTVGKCTFK